MLIEHARHDQALIMVLADGSLLGVHSRCLYANMQEKFSPAFSTWKQN